MHENAEKKRTIIDLFSPLVLNFRTIVYAAPAPIPPIRPISDAGELKISDEGLTTNKLPINAPRTISACGRETFSFNNKKEKGER